MPYAAGNLSFELFLAPIPATPASFTGMLLLADQALGTTLGGVDRYRQYNDYASMVTDAAVLSAAVLQAGQDFFAQPGNKAYLLVGRINTGGAETYSTGAVLVKAAIAAAGATYWGVCLDKRTTAEILLVAADMATDEYGMCFIQSADATWLTAGYPAALTALENNERCSVCYHDTDTEWMDTSWFGNRLAFDPDEASAGWPASLANVANNATDPTAAQQVFLEANEGNLGLEWGNATFWVGNGVNCAARPIDHILSSDWFIGRSRERLVTLVQSYSARGQKITIDTRGQSVVAGELEAQLKVGLDVGHFLVESPVDSEIVSAIVPQAITAADITALRMRYSVTLVLATGAVSFPVTVYAQAS
uniref:Tail sheath protein n=1 Tax=viral metagenome TaxID=1070528 RepID=A0A6M3M731_9ZZZZ